MTTSNPASMADETTTPTSTTSGLVKARRRIQAARERGVTPSDGGSTGRTDGND
ncbi:hypothetical protein [Streptomyces griseiscabiei]|uniref:Uncharacterized protein n=1 Tax=Streptomyces griseiscabiei TaxID=2993540 RepID=A0ABU4L9M4_9ACTN|nr:hypothetical protein [Streptomyces griseiscabiei]MBZ3906763.1 hypothetical protein [Streptomyces griseiscabiei]MDX2911859.1 hypothetical protein [Streptomyces griseiscabiei]